jgi:hypothetical protein
MRVRAWLLPLLLVPAVMGLAVCPSVWAAPGAAPPCTTAYCAPVQVSLPPPPPSSPSHPKVWAGYTRGQAIAEFKWLIRAPSDAHLPLLKAVHAQCKTFRAWKVSDANTLDTLYIVDEKKKGYWVTGGAYASALSCHP